jgi:pimeloyl-ACP methyl ester carboxylesterase
VGTGRGGRNHDAGDGYVSCETMSAALPPTLEQLAERYDASVFALQVDVARRGIERGPAPRGPNGLWTRLPDLRAPALFVWGKRDNLVPMAFEDHVREALPHSRHLELDGGHVPQLESPKHTHEALLTFMTSDAQHRQEPAPDVASRAV